MTHPALRLMRAAGSGVIESFGSDLEHHDAATLQSISADLPFVWMVQPCGTHLVRSDAANDAVEAYRDAFDPQIGSCRGTGQCWYYWNGQTLTHGLHSEVFAALVMHRRCDRNKTA